MPVVLLLCLTGAPLWAQNEATGATLRDFYEIGDYILEIAGAPVPETRFFLAERIPAVLVSPPDNTSSVLLFPRTNDVQTVPNDKLIRKTDTQLDVVMDSVTHQGKLQILASWIAFPVHGQEWILKPRPWLLGVQDIPTLLAYSPEYRWRSEAYTPNKAAVEELKSQTEDVKVRVFFGSWCAHCKRHVPLLLKVATQLEGSHIHLEFYGLPQGWGQHPVAGPLKILAVPTGVVYVDDKEVGRITGNQWRAPEVSLNEILQHQTGDDGF
jgi:thiol-disulfide isomerase/thioredoxin